MCRLAGVSYGGQEREGRPSWQRREQEQPCDAWAEGGGWCGRGGRGLPWLPTSRDQSGELQRVDFFFFFFVCAGYPGAIGGY